MQVLLKFLSHNFRIINFWLSACVLPQETRQFPESLPHGSLSHFSTDEDKVIVLEQLRMCRLGTILSESHDLGIPACA